MISLLNAGENRTKIEIETLPDYVKYAFISAEDARFYSHQGVDIKRIFGALLADLKAGYFKEGAQHYNSTARKKQSSNQRQDSAAKTTGGGIGLSA